MSDHDYTQLAADAREVLILLHQVLAAVQRIEALLDALRTRKGARA